MAVPPLADAVSELANAFSGELLQPTDSGYEEARSISELGFPIAMNVNKVRIPNTVDEILTL